MSLARIIELWEKATLKNAKQSLLRADALAGELKGRELAEAEGYLDGLAMLVSSGKTAS